MGNLRNSLAVKSRSTKGMAVSCEGPITREKWKLTHCEEHGNNGHDSELPGANHKEKGGNSPPVKSMATMGMAVSCQGSITREKLETHPLKRAYKSCKANSVNFWQVNSQPVKYEVSLSVLAVGKYIYTL